MKILFIANSIVGEEPGFTGGESRFIEIAKYWKSQGNEIHLLSSVSGRTLCERAGLSVVLHQAFQDTMTSRLTFLLRTLRLPFMLHNLLAGFDEGIVYSTNEQLYDVLPALYLKLKYRSRICWATVVHWLPPLCFWRRRSSRVLNSLLFLISERVSVYLAGFFGDRLLAVSESTKRQLLHTFVPKDKIHAVYCGVNYEEIQGYLAGQVQTYDAVFMKRVQAVKGIFDLMEIWETVVKEKKDAKLLVIGEGIDSQEASRRVKERGLEGNIEFTGTIYDPRIKYRYLSQSKLFVLPSYEENWAIVIGEAMAAGVPVIAYGLKELVSVWKEHFVAVETGNKAQFTSEILRLLHDDRCRRELSESSKAYVRQYDWRNIADEELLIIMRGYERPAS